MVEGKVYGHDLKHLHLVEEETPAIGEEFNKPKIGCTLNMKMQIKRH